MQTVIKLQCMCTHCMCHALKSLYDFYVLRANEFVCTPMHTFCLKPQSAGSPYKSF